MEIKEQGENENFSEIRNILEVVKKKKSSKETKILIWVSHGLDTRTGSPKHPLKMLRVSWSSSTLLN